MLKHILCLSHYTNCPGIFHLEHRLHVLAFLSDSATSLHAEYAQIHRRHCLGSNNFQPIQLSLIQGKDSPLRVSREALNMDRNSPPWTTSKYYAFRVKIHRKFTFSTTAMKPQVCFFEVSCLCRTSVLLRAYWDNLKANLQNQTNTSLLTVNSRPNEKEMQTPRLLKISENARSVPCRLPFLPVTSPAVCTCWV